MNPSTWWDVDEHTSVVGTERRLDHQTRMFCVRFKMSNSSLEFVAPDTSREQSRPVRSIRQLTLPMSNYVNRETANQHSRHILSTINVRPEVIPHVAPRIAFKLWLLSRHVGRLVNTINVEIRLNIRFCYCYGPRAAAADALDWATTESMDSMQPVVSRGLFGSSSSDQVEEFLGSSRVRTWDSETQCVICLERLGGDEEEKGMEEEEEVISLAGCSHLFHGAWIRKWFEVRDTCPLCRRTVNVGL
ncbi:hypothetical protein ACLOJK_008413 [Asimina triloba]